MLRRDYLERMIEELSALVAQALGLARAEQHEAAEREIASGFARLGLSARTIDRLDAASLRAMIGEKRALLRTLVEADAELATLAGDHSRAHRRATLAATLG